MNQGMRTTDTKILEAVQMRFLTPNPTRSITLCNIIDELSATRQSPLRQRNFSFCVVLICTDCMIRESGRIMVTLPATTVFLLQKH